MFVLDPSKQSLGNTRVPVFTNPDITVITPLTTKSISLTHPVHIIIMNSAVLSNQSLVNKDCVI